VNSLITAAVLAIVGLGLTMCFDILKFANFAHTELAVTGAYLAFFFNVQLHFNMGWSILFASILTGLLGMLTDRAVFKRMRGVGDVIPMVTSLGLSIVMRDGVRAFGVRISDSTTWSTQPATNCSERESPLPRLAYSRLSLWQ